MRAYRGARQLSGAQPKRGAPVKARRQRTNPQVTERQARLEDQITSGIIQPGVDIVTTGRGTCHWCGFRRGTSGHANCPPDPP